MIRFCPENAAAFARYKVLMSELCRSDTRSLFCVVRLGQYILQYKSLAFPLDTKSRTGKLCFSDDLEKHYKRISSLLNGTVQNKPL